MTNIKLLILDEHIAALDPKSSERVMMLTDKLVKANEITTLMVTHNLRFAVQYGNRLVMMHEGKAVLDIKGEEKENARVEDLLEIFDKISIEKGN
jgi:putative ABC transport system ATP-binding protein